MSRWKAVRPMGVFDTDDLIISDGLLSDDARISVCLKTSHDVLVRTKCLLNL